MANTWQLKILEKIEFLKELLNSTSHNIDIIKTASVIKSVPQYIF